MIPDPASIKSARDAAGLSVYDAAHLVHVTVPVWQRWESEQCRSTITYAHWNYFLLLTRQHPLFFLTPID